MQSIAAAVVVAVPVNKAAVNLGVNRYRQGKDDNVCKAVWVGTVKIPKHINANNDVELDNFALAA